MTNFIRGPKEKASLLSKLKEHISAPNIALKFFVQELIFVLCDEDPGAYVKVLGFGEASALLMEKNLLGSMAGNQSPFGAYGYRSKQR